MIRGFLCGVLGTAVLATPGAAASPRSSPTAVDDPQPPDVSVSSVNIRPFQARVGQRLRVEFRIQNLSDQPIHSQAPRPGTVYRQEESWRSRGYPAEPGRHRVGLTFAGREVSGTLTDGAAAARCRPRFDGQTITSYDPPRIIQGRTMLPLREVAYALGAQVHWDARTRVVSITTPGNP